MRSLKSGSLLACAVACSAIAQAQVPAGYPADYKAIVDGAKKEGKVVVYSTTDAKLVSPLIKDFEATYGQTAARGSWVELPRDDLWIFPPGRDV